MDKDERKLDRRILQTVHDITKMAHSIKRTAEKYGKLMEKKEKLSDVAISDLDTLMKGAEESLVLIAKMLETEDKKIGKDILFLEDEIDTLYYKAIERHFKRLQKNICKNETAVLYSDIIGQIERISDYSASIANHVMGNYQTIKDSAYSLHYPDHNEKDANS